MNRESGGQVNFNLAAADSRTGGTRYFTEPAPFGTPAIAAAGIAEAG